MLMLWSGRKQQVVAYSEISLISIVKKVIFADELADGSIQTKEML